MVHPRACGEHSRLVGTETHHGSRANRARSPHHKGAGQCEGKVREHSTHNRPSPHTGASGAID